MSHTIKNFTIQFFPSSSVPLSLALREQSNVVGALGLCAVTTAPTSTRRVLPTSPRCSKTSRKPWSLGYALSTFIYSRFMIHFVTLVDGNGAGTESTKPLFFRSTSLTTLTRSSSAWVGWVRFLFVQAFVCLCTCTSVGKYGKCVCFYVKYLVKYLELFVWQILTCVRWWNCSTGKVPKMPPSTTLLRCWQRL